MFMFVIFLFHEKKYRKKKRKKKKRKKKEIQNNSFPFITKLCLLFERIYT